MWNLHILWYSMPCMENKPCVFCSSSFTAVHQNDSAIAALDNYPVTAYHTLIIPRRHISSFFELTKNEQQSCLDLLLLARTQLLLDDPSITGFNVGINDGIDAGQTIMHCHIHLIPRRKNDVKTPSGGIRHIIPEKGDYTKSL